MSEKFDHADTSEGIADCGLLSKAASTVASTSVSAAASPAHHGRGELNPTVAASLAAAAALRLQQPPQHSAHVDPTTAVVVGSGSASFPPGLHQVAPANSQIPPLPPPPPPPASAISDSLYGNPLMQTIMRLQQYQNMASLNPFLAAAAAANTLSPDAAVAAVAAVAAAQQQQQQQHQLQMATILAQAQAMQQAAATAAAAAAITKTSTSHQYRNSSDSAQMPSNAGGDNSTSSNMDLYRDYLSKYVKATSISTSNATIPTKSIAPSVAPGESKSQLFLSSARLSTDQQLQEAAIRSVASSSLTTSTTSSPLKFNIADLDPTSILSNVTGTLNQQRSPISGGPAGHLATPLPLKRQNSNSSSSTTSSVPRFSSMAAAAVAAAAAATASSDYGSAAGGSGSSRGSTSVAVHQNGRDKVFTCKICNRSFGYKHVLQNHERTHTGEKPFECKVCHKRFTRDHHLKTHMRLHTGEKPYHCTHCERQFVQVANLRRHLRVHTGEKPYKCDLCSSHFSDSNQLKAHILIHKGEKPFSCEHCSGKFRRRHHLMHHVCPKGGGGGGVTSGHHIEGDDIDDTVESEKMALLKKWPLPPPLPHPPSGSDESERRESIDAPSALVPAIALADQNTAHVMLLQQQKTAAMSMAVVRDPDDEVRVPSIPVVGSDTEKQRNRKARDPKKRAFNTTAATSVPFTVSNQDNDDVESVSSPEEDRGRHNMQTEPEDLSNKDSMEQKSTSPANPLS